MTTASDIPWYDAVAYPPREGTLRWSCRLGMLLHGQVVTVTQGEEAFLGPLQAYPGILALAGELLARSVRQTHFVLMLEEHRLTRQDFARIVIEQDLPLTTPQRELQHLRPLAEAAFMAPGTPFGRPLQAMIILAPPYIQPHLHVINRAEVQ